MVKDEEMLSKFEDNYIRSSKTSFSDNLLIFNSMYELAVRLKAFPPKDKLEGIETDIRVALILNSLREI